MNCFTQLLRLSMCVNEIIFWQTVSWKSIVLFGEGCISVIEHKLYMSEVLGSIPSNIGSNRRKPQHLAWFILFKVAGFCMCLWGRAVGLDHTMLCLKAAPGSAQETAPVVLGEPYMVLGIEPRSAIFKASTLFPSCTISLTPLLFGGWGLYI